MNAPKAHAYIVNTRFAVKQFIHLYSRISDALPYVPKDLDAAFGEAAKFLPLLNNALSAIEDHPLSLRP